MTNIFDDAMQGLFEAMIEQAPTEGAYRASTTSIDSPADATLNGVFERHLPQPLRVDQFGERVPTTATYWLAAGTTLDRKGKITIKSEHWNIDAVTNDAQGRVVVQLQLPGTKRVPRTDNMK